MGVGGTTSTSCLGSVLVISPDNAANRVLLEVLARDGIRAFVAEDYRAGLEFLDRHECDLVFVALEYLIGQAKGDPSWIDGYLVRQLRTNQPELPLVAILGWAELEVSLGDQVGSDRKSMLEVTTSVVQEAMKIGIDGFLCKPLDQGQVAGLLRRFFPAKNLAHVAYAEQAWHSLYQIIGKSRVMTRTVSLARKLAMTSAPVMICGESGTGKELFARLIHSCSHRSHGPYVQVNCAALSDTLLDSELFGHERGSFTGALAQHKGRFERANGGTILLDEVTETPLRFQAKLLRVLEQQELERVGGREPIRVNVRVISTTNSDICDLVRRGRFRQDLYYRLCAAKLVMPPLRDRIEDLEELVWYFVNAYARESQRTIHSLDPAMMELFGKYDWPGNVRQLRNVIRTCLILDTGPVLRLADTSWLMDEAKTYGRLEQPPAPAPGTPRGVTVEGPYRLGGMPLEDLERMAILQTLAQTCGNKKKAAGILGISDRTLREKIRRYRQELQLEACELGIR